MLANRADNRGQPFPGDGDHTRTCLSCSARDVARSRGARRGSTGGYRDGTGCFRSEEHTSELQSLMRSSYAVFCLKKKNTQKKPLRAQTIQREVLTIMLVPARPTT